MRKGFLVASLMLLLVGLFFGEPISITGGVISYSLTEFSFLNFLLILISSFLLVFGLISGDPLQDRLAEMETENPSSEVSLNKKGSGLGRRKWWGGKRKVEMISRLPENKYSQDVQNPIPDWEKRREIEGRYLSREKREAAENEYSKARFKLRKIEHKTRPGGSPSNGRGLSINDQGELIFPFTHGSIRSLSSTLKSQYEKLGGENNRLFGKDKKINEDQLLENLEPYYRPIKEALDKEVTNYLSTDARQKSISELDKRVRPILAHKEAIEGANYSSRKEELVRARNNAISSNIDKIPYVDMSRLSESGVVLLHGIPYQVGSRDVLRATYNNPSFTNSLNRLMHNPQDTFDGELLLSEIIKNRPAISTFSVSSNSSDLKFFQPFGIVLGTNGGRIYDASPSDLVSIPVGNQSEARLASHSQEPGSLEERVLESIRHSTSHSLGIAGHQDEFLVGGNYHVQGIYALPKLLENADTRREIYALSKQHNLPVYTFKKGEGLVLYEGTPKVKRTILGKREKVEV